MSGDRIRLSRLAAEQERALARYVRRDVYPHSAFYRHAIDEAGLRPTFARSLDEFARLPVTRFEAAFEHLPSLVMVAATDRLLREGDRSLAMRILWARLSGHGARVDPEIVDPLFRPVLWTVDGPLRLASTAADLERLAELGRRWLEQAGLHRSDLVLSLFPAATSTAFWQLHLGARRAGVAITSLEPAAADRATVRSWRPTALAGAAAHLERLLDDLADHGEVLPALHTVLVVGEPLAEGVRTRLSDLAAAVGGPEQPAVVTAWAPPGVRAVWSECRGGRAFHIWPAGEVVEVVDGRLVWSAVGWRGTALLRLSTGVRAELDGGPCPVCGRTTPRLRVGGGGPGAV